ncbi:MAG TPA: IS1595 family transposase [Tepidisphaeraceae bacterium]
MNARENIPNPETLVEAVRVFADEDAALRFMVSLRWPKGVCCPRCGSTRVRFISTRRVWECRESHPSKRFSLKTNTIMEDSPLSLGTWLVGIWLEANAKNSISSYEVHRHLGITQKSAWFMQQRIRLAMQEGNFFRKMSGEVEADETFIGGKSMNMHKSRRAKTITGTGGKGKAVVMGLLERHTEKKCSQVRARVVSGTGKHALHEVIRHNVEPGTHVYTDAWQAYRSLPEMYVHKFIDHAEKYVDGAVHTNGLENFWALFKRCIKGTHVSVEPFHLFRYVDAEAFRFNNRKTNDGARFVSVIQSVPGKRLTYKTLIGDDCSASGNSGVSA